MNKTLVFTATYNEVENINILIKKILIKPSKVDLLIIDDNSPDNTKETIYKLKKRYKNLHLIVRERKLGLDTAHKLAYQFALRRKYKNLITMDADLSHDPKVINKMIKVLNKNEFVIGSRYMKGGKCEMGLLRLSLSSLGNKFIKLLLNINCHEFTTSYRGFNIKKLKKFHLKKINSKGYSFFMETIFYINKLNFKIVEVPIHFKDRINGKSKIPKFELFRTLKNVLFLALKKNFFN